MANTPKNTGRVLRDLTSDKDAEIAELKARLEAAEKMQPVTKTTITLEEYQGKPVLHFQGAFRPFHMGQAKCKVMLENVKIIERFIKTKGKSIT